MREAQVLIYTFIAIFRVVKMVKIEHSALKQGNVWNLKKKKTLKYQHFIVYCGSQ